ADLLRESVAPGDSARLALRKLVLPRPTTPRALGNLQHVEFVPHLPPPLRFVSRKKAPPTTTRERPLLCYLVSFMRRTSPLPACSPRRRPDTAPPSMDRASRSRRRVQPGRTHACAPPPTLAGTDATRPA